MDRDFNIVDEVQRHPGVVAGVVAVLAGVGLATLLLNQRTGPRRYEVLKARVDPRGWFDAESVRQRFDDIARGVRRGADDLSHRAADLGGYAGDRAGRMGADARHVAEDWLRPRRPRRKPMRRYVKKARRYAEDAGEFASDHAREGGALLAIATIAAAIGAAALESRRRDA